MEIKKDILVQAVVKKQAAKTGEREERIWGLLEQIESEHEDIINILTESLFGTISLNSEKTDYVVENPAVDPPFKRSQNNIEVLVLK